MPATQPAGASVPATTGAAAIVAKAEEMGFEGLDLGGYGAFPMVSLKQGTFSCSDGWTLPDPFYAVLLSSKKKWLYTNGLPDSDPGKEIFYTYDQVVSISGEAVEDLVAAWRAKGQTPVIKNYLDVAMRLVGGEHDGTAVALSVPKTSIGRLSAHWANMMASGQPIENIVTKISKGPIVKTKKGEFIPIYFDIYRG